MPRTTAAPTPRRSPLPLATTDTPLAPLPTRPHQAPTPRPPPTIATRRAAAPTRFRREPRAECRFRLLSATRAPPVRLPPMMRGHRATHVLLAASTRPVMPLL